MKLTFILCLMSIDEIISKDDKISKDSVRRGIRRRNESIYLMDQVTPEDFWIYYAISKKDRESAWMDRVHVFFVSAETLDGRILNFYFINLKSCYKDGVYDIRCLVEFILYGPLYKFIGNKEIARNLANKLLEGYKFSEIKT